MVHVFTIYSIFFLATSMVSFFVAFLAWRRRLVKGGLELTLLMFAAGIWAFWIIFETAATTQVVKIFWSKLAYMGAVTTPVLYFIFVLRFTGKDKFISFKNVLLLFCIPFITLILAATNESHHLVWSGFSAISTSTNMMEYYHGVWFWIGYFGYNYILLFLATIYLIIFIVSQSKTFRSQGLVIFIGGLCPWIASAIYVTGSNPVPGLDLTPVSIIWSGVLLTYAILYIRLLDLLPVARETLVETLPDGIIALDGQNRIQDINSAAIAFLGIPDRNVLGQTVEGSDATEKALLNVVIDQNQWTKIEMQSGNDNRTYRITKQSIKNQPDSRLIIISDITVQSKTEREIKKRDLLLDAVTKATVMLLQGGDLEEGIHKALEIIGKATKVSRVYIFRNHFDPEYKMPLTSQLYEWTDGTVEPQINNPKLQNLPYETVLPRWFELLSAGKVIFGNINDFPVHEREILEPQEIKSILVTPVSFNKKLWGFIGFDECFREREWEPMEKQLLTTAANTFGTAYLRKINRDELIAAKERAEESDRLKTAFLANVGHEIRTPMNAIMGFSGLLKEQGLSREDQLDFVEMIEKSGTRLLNIINDITDISKIESGLMKATLSETNVNEQVKSICNFYKSEAEVKGLSLSFTETLPSDKAVITTDREKLGSIIKNVLNNAIKFTQIGSIEIGIVKKDKFLEFFVKDTGPGISPEKQKVIFERFRQGSESLTRSYEGAGLGLAISKAYIEMLGGEIRVVSEEGKGSVFYFTVPNRYHFGVD